MIKKNSIVYIAYNRPELTKLTFQIIKKYKPREIFLILDGPKKNDLLDQINCNKVKNIVTDIKWKCKIYKNFSKDNTGLKKRIITGLDWVFSKTEKAIILEDDCLVGLDFFNFCNLMLDKYKNNSEAFMISGTNFLENEIKDEFFFSNYGIFWGWATWRKSWKLYRSSKNFWIRNRNRINWKRISNSKKIIQHWIGVFNKVYLKNYNTWDYQFWASMWFYKKYAIIPKLNLVRNLGFGQNSTHTKNINDNKIMKKLNKFKKPSYFGKLLRYQKYDDKLAKKFFLEITLLNFFKKKIYNIYSNFFIYNNKRGY